MPKRQQQIKNILEAAFHGKDTNGNPIMANDGFPLVDDDTFKISIDDEDRIRYWVYSSVRYFQTNDNYLAENKNVKLTKDLASYHDGKVFLFFLIDDYPDHLFSLEIIDFPEKINKTVSICSKDQLKNIVNEQITRTKGTNGYYYIVAIKLTDSNGNPDYTALKHYIISSDNRTYNKVVRNMVEYIFTKNNQTVPENKPELPHNLLVSGAPGTGKSHYLKTQFLKTGGAELSEENEYKFKTGSCLDIILNYDEVRSEEKPKEAAIQMYSDTYMTRVTFYEDYSYENFIGCYKPTPAPITANIEYDSKTGTITENKITYEFVPGPFIDTYIKAIEDPGHNYYLIIEEINRAKAASVFGDMFQLLDRKNGISEYEIRPDSALDGYLRKNLRADYNGTIKLPSNMYLWATMNSADQGVMPLDSAFKRRWAPIYMDINNEQNARDDKLKLSIAGEIKFILWEKLRTAINNVILKHGFDEDRCIGSWYFSKEEIEQINTYFSKNEEDRKNMVNPLIDKLIYYLRQDLFRIDPGRMFKSEISDKPGISMSDLRRRVRQSDDKNTFDKIFNIDALDWNPLTEKCTDDSNAESADPETDI